MPEVTKKRKGKIKERRIKPCHYDQRTIDDDINLDPTKVPHEINPPKWKKMRAEKPQIKSSQELFMRRA